MPDKFSSLDIILIWTRIATQFFFVAPKKPEQNILYSTWWNEISLGNFWCRKLSWANRTHILHAQYVWHASIVDNLNGCIIDSKWMCNVIHSFIIQSMLNKMLKIWIVQITSEWNSDILIICSVIYWGLFSVCRKQHNFLTAAEVKSGEIKLLFSRH